MRLIPSSTNFYRDDLLITDYASGFDDTLETGVQNTANREPLIWFSYNAYDAGEQ